MLARFPDQAEDALIKQVWLERARQRIIDDPANNSGGGPLFAGVDVGGGQAETVAYLCERVENRWRVVAMEAWRGEDTRGQVISFLNDYRARITLVRVDSIGIGHNFALALRDARFPVELVNVALPCESKSNLGENDPARRFVNLKAQFYQSLADLLERDQLDGMTDEETIAQLAAIRFEIDSQGRLKIESKESARARGVPSPDRAEALMLALAKPPQKFEYYTIRDRPQLSGRAQAAPSYIPFPPMMVEAPYHDDADDYRPLRSRRWDIWVGPCDVRALKRWY